MFKSWKIGSKWSATDFYNDEFKNIYFKFLIGLNIDLVHIQHLIRHTHDLPKVANVLGLPIILSFHDFYYICPSINLLDHNNTIVQVDVDRRCNVKYPAQIFDDLPILSEFNDTWRKEVSLLIDNCSAFTAPTKFTMDIYISIYPQLKNKICKVIEHGRDFETTYVNVEIPSKDKPIKIIVPWNY